jgi:mono/diheme cytochrome c family protein
MQSSTVTPKPRWPLVLVIILFVVASVSFVILLGIATQPVSDAPTELTADTYMDEVTRLLEGADASNGALLVEQYQCIACHRIGAENGVAPAFVGIAERAATRRPPLTAAAYIYESIVNPTALVVEGFGPVMLQDYRDQLSDRQLGDIIAYLLTPDAH